MNKYDIGLFMLTLTNSLIHAVIIVACFFGMEGFAHFWTMTGIAPAILLINVGICWSVATRLLAFRKAHFIASSSEERST